MTKEDQAYLEPKELNMSRDELLEVIVRERKKNLVIFQALTEAQNYIVENQRSLHTMSGDYNEMKDLLHQLQEKNEELNKDLSRLQDQNALKTAEQFGCKSEKARSLQASENVQEEIDEASITQQTKQEAKPAGNETKSASGKNHGKKQVGKREQDLSSLPVEDVWLWSAEVVARILNGEGYLLWHWEHRDTIEVRENPFYVRRTWYPVLSVGEDHHPVRFFAPVPVIPNSLLSPSLAAYLIMEHFVMFAPYARMERAYENLSLILPRQNIANWMIWLAKHYFIYLRDYQTQLMIESGYNQVDETTWRVNKNDRRTGSKDYIWAHATSELLKNTHAIKLFFYGPSRSASHLRDIYENEEHPYEGIISCDAYEAYPVLEKETEGKITISGCMAHCRRRLVNAVRLIDKKAYTQEEYEALAPVKALDMIGKIYAEEGKLRDLSEEQRKKERNLHVRPLMDAFYSFIESIDTKDPLISEKFQDAIQYALNQKSRLYVFLEDGNVPIDNNHAERTIRSIVQIRKNSLFSDSVKGAEAMTIIASIVATAQANGANVIFYIQYVLEQMAGYRIDFPPAFLETLMPWSEEYKAYEAKRSAHPAGQLWENEYSSEPPIPKVKGSKSRKSASVP